MTKTEIENLTRLVKGEYSFIREDDLLKKCKTWHEVVTIPYPRARAALIKLLRTVTHCPTGAEILKADSDIREDSDRQTFGTKKPICPNCNGIGAVLILRNGTEYGFQCPCAAGAENYNGWPMLPPINTISDGKMMASGQQVEEDLDF